MTTAAKIVNNQKNLSKAVTLRDEALLDFFTGLSEASLTGLMDLVGRKLATCHTWPADQRASFTAWVNHAEGVVSTVLSLCHE